MEKTTGVTFVATVCVAVLIATTQPVIAGITNGNFYNEVNPNDNFGWETASGQVDFTDGDDGHAVLVQGPDVSPPDSVLYQLVTLEDNENWLSFHLLMNTGPPPGETDYFYATLNGTVVCDTWSSKAIVVDEYGYGTREEIITFDVSTWARSSYDLVFRLNHDPIDGYTEVTIDGVMLTSGPPIVPVPGALLLGGLGSALVVLLRRYV